MEDKKQKPEAEQQRNIQRKISDQFGELSRYEAVIKRTEEIKTDSIKIKMFEDMILELKGINEKLEKLDFNIDALAIMIKKNISNRKDFY